MPEFVLTAGPALIAGSQYTYQIIATTNIYHTMNDSNPYAGGTYYSSAYGAWL